MLVSTLLSGITVVYLETQITDGGKSQLTERREVVTCHSETRDLRCDIHGGRCHGDRGNSCRCQVLPGQRKRTRHGIFTDVLLIFLFKFVSLLCFLSSAFINFVFFSFCSSHSPPFLLFSLHFLILNVRWFIFMNLLFDYVSQIVAN